jgi:reactive intermediate/imine deaminase
MKKIINTVEAPSAIGPYSQAVQYGQTVYFSGQIGLNPDTMDLAGTDIHTQVEQVLKNLSAVAKAAKGSLADIIKLNIYLTDLAHFGTINDYMEKYFKPPYPARATIEVSALPKNALVEIDAIMILGLGD